MGFPHEELRDFLKSGVAIIYNPEGKIEAIMDSKFQFRAKEISQAMHGSGKNIEINRSPRHR